MKIGIITLPLHTNYGGILQAYALKTFLESVGHEAIVLDPIDKMPAPGGLRAPFVYASRMLKRGLKGKKGPEVFREHRFRRELPVVGKNISAFIEKYISMSTNNKLTRFMNVVSEHKGMSEEQMAPYFEEEFKDTYFYFYFFVRNIKTNCCF